MMWLTEGHLPYDVGGSPRRKTSREHIDQTLLPVESWYVPLPFPALSDTGAQALLEPHGRASEDEIDIQIGLIWVKEGW